MTQPDLTPESRPTTEAGRSLLDEYAETVEGEWGTGKPDPLLRSEIAGKVAAIEAAARAPLEAQNAQLREALERIMPYCVSITVPPKADVEHAMRVLALSPSSTDARPPEPDALARLDSFAALEKGWDSYGGAPITPEAIAAARLALTGTPFVVPTSQGGVAIEWQDADREISLDIRPDGNPVGNQTSVALREALRSIAWNESDGPCWCATTPDQGPGKTGPHDPRCLAIRSLLAQPNREGEPE